MNFSKLLPLKHQPMMLCKDVLFIIKPNPAFRNRLLLNYDLHLATDGLVQN